MLIHPSPSWNNIKRSGVLSSHLPAGLRNSSSGNACMHVHVRMYICTYTCDVKYITHPISYRERVRPKERERERATHHMVGELSARITRATHLSYIWWEHFPYEFRLIDGWMDDAAIARFFSRYLDAHFSTILAVGLLRQLNAEQY